MREDYILNLSSSESIQVSTYKTGEKEVKDCILFIHGFKGFKDWGFGPFIGEYFAKKGFFVFTFNFSHNGIGNNNLEFTELDKFSKNTYSREVSELYEIIDILKSDSSINKIGLIGHSRGGVIAILAATLNNVDALCTWASISKIDRYTERQKKEWRKNGNLINFNSRTKQEMNLGLELLDDIEINKDSSLSIEKALNKINIPHLIVHGSQDLVVSVKEAEDLDSWSINGNSQKFIVKNTGHTFGVQHPFNGTNDKFENILNKTFEFFNSNF
ncbi:MAG: alpha/beta hydrolase [Melioribacteraceae bacterium]|nr:alpha/beta hydrolase [Melioribacteraceae bacterium]